MLGEKSRYGATWENDGRVCSETGSLHSKLSHLADEAIGGSENGGKLKSTIDGWRGLGMVDPISHSQKAVTYNWLWAYRAEQI